MEDTAQLVPIKPVLEGEQLEKAVAKSKFLYVQYAQYSPPLFQRVKYHGRKYLVVKVVLASGGEVEEWGTKKHLAKRHVGLLGYEVWGIDIREEIT